MNKSPGAQEKFKDISAAYEVYKEKMEGQLVLPDGLFGESGDRGINFNFKGHHNVLFKYIPFPLSFHKIFSIKMFQIKVKNLERTKFNYMKGKTEKRFVIMDQFYIAHLRKQKILLAVFTLPIENILLRNFWYQEGFGKLVTFYFLQRHHITNYNEWPIDFFREGYG